MAAAPRIGPGRVLLDVVEQHAEEAAFLWLLRDQAVDAPHYAPRHLARLEERVEAHVDGLRVAGEVGFEVAMAELDRHPEMGELFAASTLALESADPARLGPLVEIARAAPEARRGLFGAVGWVGPGALKPWVRGWLDSADPFQPLLGVVACSLHRVDPDTKLVGFLHDPDPAVRARAYRLAGELGRVDLRGDIAAAIVREAGDARDWAAWSAGLLGDPLALRELEAVAEGAGPVAGPALEVVARRSPPERVVAWVRALNGDAAKRRLAIKALGALGDPAAVLWLIDKMRGPDLARIAGESFALITGADLDHQDLNGEAPEGLTAGAGDETFDADEHLPYPDSSKITAWWQASAARFASGTRHLLGRPTDADAGEDAWREGHQRQRRAAAYELAVMGTAIPLRPWRMKAAAAEIS
jgi:uncharacterized protein (TIGR02270 family)